MSFSVKRLPVLRSAFGLLVIVSSVCFAVESVEDRIKPVGDVCMAGDPCAAAAVASNASVEPRGGEEVYATKCVTCHATGAAGAPKLGVPEWEVRLSERTLDGLYVSAIEGYKGMPAKGLCMDCSDQEIKDAVDYMLVSE